MDKKLLLRPKLAQIMADLKNSIVELTQFHNEIEKTLKDDGSPVTQLDLALSLLLEKMSAKHYPEATFYSEEKFSTWQFPLVVVDPLDGTKEYIKKRPQWAVSVGIFLSREFQGEGWVYNPVTNELFNSDISTVNHVDKSKYYGEVSHSEWDTGLYKSFTSEKYSLKPMGSIAYKLGRLAGGKIDFVISLTPKNIWDIAGGTLLCHQSKMKFYSEGKEVTEVKPLYRPPLIWCHEELFEEISSLV